MLRPKRALAKTERQVALDVRHSAIRRSMWTRRLSAVCGATRESRSPPYLKVVDALRGAHARYRRFAA